MAVFEKSEFAQWRNSDVHKDFEADINDKRRLLAEEIISRQSTNVDRDMFVRGVLAGLSVVLDWKPTFKAEEEENDEEA